MGEINVIVIQVPPIDNPKIMRTIKSLNLYIEDEQNENDYTAVNLPPYDKTKLHEILDKGCHIKEIS